MKGKQETGKPEHLQVTYGELYIAEKSGKPMLILLKSITSIDVSSLTKMQRSAVNANLIDEGLAEYHE